MAGALEKLIKDVTMDSATFAMNSGRCTIKAKDVQAALGISARSEQKP
jgi:histone H3/H4